MAADRKNTGSSPAASVRAAIAKRHAGKEGRDGAAGRGREQGLAQATLGLSRSLDQPARDHVAGDDAEGEHEAHLVG